MLTRLAVEFVVIFFVLSGFSIAHSINKSKNIAQFYTKRLIRIYPPYLIAIIWALVVYFITYSLKPEFFNPEYKTLVFSRYNFMQEYLGLDGFVRLLLYLPPMDGFVVQFWSLSYEVIFYILTPIIFLMNRKIYNILSVALFLCYLIFFEIFAPAEFDNVLLRYFLIYNFFFFLGSTLYQNFHWVNKKIEPLSRKTFTIILLFLLLITYAVNIGLQKESVWSYIPASILGSGLILYFLKYQVQINSMIKIGKYSYTLYISHVATIFLYHTLYYTIFPQEPLPHIKNYMVFMPAIFLSLLVAYLQYYIVERQTRNILNRIRRKH